MRVLIVNTSERVGGAAVAANRLMEALNNHGVKAKMLVREKGTDTLTVVGLKGRWRQQWCFLWERLVIYLHLHCSRKHLFEVDIANVGTDITRLPEFKEADVIHLHWINQGMLSIGDIRKILRSGKPVVWTMHDIWPATAICHLTLGCAQFKSGCHHCKYLPGGGSSKDLAAQVWRKKKLMLEHHSITFVACSRWLESEARQSSLFTNQKVVSIPNPIDTHLYKVKEKSEARKCLQLPVDKNVILFVSQRATNRNKGMNYLVEACNLMASQHPEMTEKTCVAILGGQAEEVARLLPFECCPLGYVSDEHCIVDIYNAADVFVLPSLSENLPNSIMEALACGVPCVGFKVGGIPEEIDHQKNGYVAAYRDAQDLARGIQWVLQEADYEALSKAAVAKVNRCYSQQSVALKYTEVYNEAIAQKHYKL
jgi:glycosyltransferase involved in cell wall biosynthesis